MRQDLLCWFAEFASGLDFRALPRTPHAFWLLHYHKGYRFHLQREITLQLKHFPSPQWQSVRRSALTRGCGTFAPPIASLSRRILIRCSPLSVLERSKYVPGATYVQ